MIIADTGAIIALVDADDRHHASVRNIFDASPGAWVLPWATLPEIDYLLGTHVGKKAQDAFLSDLADSAFVVAWGTTEDLVRARALHVKYRSLRLGLVDGVVIAIAERLRAKGIVTLDVKLKRRRRRPWFMAADPHVPLAVARDGKLRGAVPAADRGSRCGSTSRWASVGSKWHALDLWGQIVATATIGAIEDPPYDVTGCREVTFNPQKDLAHDDRSIFVFVDSVWRPSASVKWTPPSHDRAAFEKLVSSTLPEPDRMNGHCSQLPSRFTYFDKHWALGAKQGGWVIATHGSGGWKKVNVHRDTVNGLFGSLCYRPIAIFYMNADGVPEIVLCFDEGVSWGEEVLQLGADGTWSSVAVSPGGSTAYSRRVSGLALRASLVSKEPCRSRSASRSIRSLRDDHRELAERHELGRGLRWILGNESFESTEHDAVELCLERPPLLEFADEHAQELRTIRRELPRRHSRARGTRSRVRG